MIRLIFEQDREYIGDTTYPDKYLETVIDSDDTLYTLFYELVSTAKTATYVVTRDVWNDIGDYIEERGGFDELSFKNYLNEEVENEC